MRYVLFEVAEGTHNNSLYKHPLNAMLEVNDKTQLTNEIAKRVREGTPVQKLKVFTPVDFIVDIDIMY